MRALVPEKVWTLVKPERLKLKLPARTPFESAKKKWPVALTSCVSIALIGKKVKPLLSNSSSAAAGPAPSSRPEAVSARAVMACLYKVYPPEVMTPLFRPLAYPALWISCLPE